MQVIYFLFFEKKKCKKNEDNLNNDYSLFVNSLQVFAYTEKLIIFEIT